VWLFSRNRSRTAPAFSAVVNIRSDEIEDTPDFGVSLENDYFLGMAKVKGAVKILLDIDWGIKSALNRTENDYALLGGITLRF